MSLQDAADCAPNWLSRTRPGAAVTDCFTFPYLGAPWEHACTPLRSTAATLNVVVPTWNSGRSLAHCLDGLALSSLNRAAPHRLKVIVCDDGSDDSTRDDLRAKMRDLDLHVLRLEHRSQSYAINAALTRAEADVLVFCDADMILGCGALDEIAARHERWPDVVCAGFRSDIESDAVPDDPAGLADRIHREALTSDNRLRFHMPTLIPNMMHATGWLTRLGRGRYLLDCEGSQWRRHRYVFGCLFSASRELVAEVQGMPEIVPRWGYQDTLMAARLEAVGGFVLPVATAWGHHVVHDIRHADQWFQYDRNRLAYEEILSGDLQHLPWRAPTHASAVIEEWSTGPVAGTRSTPNAIRGAAEPAGAAGIAQAPASVAPPELFHAIGLWQRCLDELDRVPWSPRRDALGDECLFRLGRHESLAGSATLVPSVWQAVALLRIDKLAEARQAFARGDRSDPATSFALSASVPEVIGLAKHFANHDMPDVARLYQDVAVLLDG